MLSKRQYRTRTAIGAVVASALAVLPAGAAYAAGSPATTSGSISKTVPANGLHKPAPAGIEWNSGSLTEVSNPAGRYYTYAPSVVRDGNTEWIWSCHNDEAGVIKDHVYLTKRLDGEIQESHSVLQASPAPAWDSFHVCDPSVITGNYSYNGQRYRYAMFYLGNDLDASAHNQIGVAFAKNPEGPWVKFPDPLVTSNRTDQWGVGQPSAIALPGRSGRVILAYTRGDTSTRAYIRQLDMSNMQHLKIGEPILLPTAGLVGRDGESDYLNGYDIALDRSGQRVYTVREQHPYPNDNPWWIGASVQVNSIDTADLLTGKGTWRVEGAINEELTGFARNHNAGFVRTWRGYLPQQHSLAVVFTDSCASLPTVDNPDWSLATCDSLFSYDLWEIAGSIR